MPDTRTPYWNPLLETLSRDKLEKIQLKNFREHLQYARDHAAFYGHRYRDVDPRSIRTRQDIRHLPLVDKEL